MRTRTLLAAAILLGACSSSPSTSGPHPCNAGASCFCTATVEGTIECSPSGARCACPPDPSSPAPSACAGYTDEDGDGFGAGPLIDQGCPARTHLAPRGGDCADHDARAFPGQKAFFFDPVGNFAETGHESWDFDCDGREEPHWPAATAACTSCPTTFAAETWIAAAAPSCGSVGTLATGCATDSSSACTPTSRSAAQECR